MNQLAKNFVQRVQAPNINVMVAVKSLSRFLAKWMVTTVVGTTLAVVIGARVTRIFAGPENYKIYVIGKLGAKDDLKNLFAAIKEGQVPNLTIDTKPIKIEKRDDKGDPHSAEQIAREIAGLDDTLLVLGHVLSTQTKTALPYYQGAKPPIPVILTTETNPELLPQQVSAKLCPPAIALSPNDDKQVETASRFAVSRANNFWVVAGTKNHIYSQYLASQFISQVNSSNKRVILSSTNEGTPSIDALKALKIEAVFFAGGWVDALTLIRQVRAFTLAGAFPSVDGPMVILSDGAVDKSLLQQGGKDVDGVFLTHPLTATEYNDETKGYTQYGKNAYILAQTLIGEADKEFSKTRREQAWLSYWVKQMLNIHRVSDARAVLNNVIQGYVTHRDGPNSLTECKYQRNETAEESDSGFHVWQIQNGQFADAS
jgi:ABC-type branched-subunit amino acid transport system substrate-binding protein